jgi:hypothetical protein
MVDVSVKEINIIKSKENDKIEEYNQLKNLDFISSSE